MLHSILRSLFESLVRVSLPSSPRARASRLPFFSKNSSDELGSRRLEKNRWIWIPSMTQMNLSLSLSDSLCDRNSTAHFHRFQILSLSLSSRRRVFFVCLRSRFTSKAVCLYEAFLLFINPYKVSLRKSPPLCALFDSLVRSSRDIFWFDFSPLFWLVKNTRRKEEQK